jgi:hypothetical protein
MLKKKKTQTSILEKGLQNGRFCDIIEIGWGSV